MRIIRVFPRRTKFTPVDNYAFVGDPPMMRPEADRVEISVTFSWDIEYAYHLLGAWGQYYEDVAIGGPAFNLDHDGLKREAFKPGFYIKRGVTITSRGCKNQCSWCLVPIREGTLFEIGIKPGYVIQDNNFLQCNREHIERVFAMLRTQRAAVFSGGLDSRLLKGWHVEELRRLKIGQLFFAADTKASLKPLEKAIKKLNGLSRDKLRCYILLAYDGQTIDQAKEQLEAVWNIGCMPFAQLYQPPDKWIEYSQEWKDLRWFWSRPAAMKAIHHNKVKLTYSLEGK